MITIIVGINIIGSAFEFAFPITKKSISIATIIPIIAIKKKTFHLILLLTYKIFGKIPNHPMNDKVKYAHPSPAITSSNHPAKEIRVMQYIKRINNISEVIQNQPFPLLDSFLYILTKDLDDL